MATKYIGLSFSFCVSDIVDGLVSYDQVEKIVTGTAATSSQDWDEIIQTYREAYWYDNPDACEHIARRLLKEKKVEQPRLHGKASCDITDGNWLVDGKPTRLQR